MSSSIHDLFQRLLTGWFASGTVPASPIEGATPEFTNILQVDEKGFSFDSFIGRANPAEWTWKFVEFRQVFDGQFAFYVPASWALARQTGNGVLFAHGTQPQQSILLAQKAAYRPQFVQLLGTSHVLAFAYYPLLRPHFHQWLVVSRNAVPGQVRATAIFPASDWLVVVEGTASGEGGLKDQLTALVNSNPWHGWIQAAKRQSPRNGKG